MLVVTVELISANTGLRTTLGTALIYNEGTGTDAHGNYTALTLRKGTRRANWKKAKPVRRARVLNYPRLRQPVWALVTEALLNLGYKWNK